MIFLSVQTKSKIITDKSLAPIFTRNEPRNTRIPRIKHARRHFHRIDASKLEHPPHSVGIPFFQGFHKSMREAERLQEE
jgi:hypothetical protein